MFLCENCNNRPQRGQTPMRPLKNRLLQAPMSCSSLTLTKITFPQELFPALLPLTQNTFPESYFGYALWSRN